MFKKKSNNWEFPFLWAWNIEDTAYHLNKADFTNFKGGNLGLTKKELMWATFVRSSFIVLWVNNTSTTAKQTLRETYQYLAQLNKLLCFSLLVLESHWIARKVTSAVCPSSRQFYVCLLSEPRGWCAWHSYQYKEFWRSCQPLIFHPTFLTQAN